MIKIIYVIEVSDSESDLGLSNESLIVDFKSRMTITIENYGTTIRKITILYYYF